MKVVIDTNILVKAFVHNEQDPLITVCSLPQARGNMKLCHDQRGVIREEYERNVGKSRGFQLWYIRLAELQAVYYCSGDLPRKHELALRTHQCHEPTDLAFIGTAYNSDRILVTEDSDMGKGPKGTTPPHGDALAYMTTEMGLKVYDASEFWQTGQDS